MTYAALKAAREALIELETLIKLSLAYDGYRVGREGRLLGPLTEADEILERSYEAKASINSALASGEPEAPQDEVEAVAKVTANKIRYGWDGLPDSTAAEFPCTWHHSRYGSISNISKDAFRDLARAAISALDSHRSARTEPPVPDGIAEEFERLIDNYNAADSGSRSERMAEARVFEFVLMNRDVIRDALRAADGGKP